MEAVIFRGIQASGKSTFYLQRFFATHVRISLDVLRTRHRERLLLRACLDGGQPFVVDNTNPTVAERARYVVPAREAGFRVVGYFFEPDPTGAVRRNAARPERQRVPAVAVYATRKRLEQPTLSEGFAALYRVQLDGAGGFVVEQDAQVAP